MSKRKQPPASSNLDDFVAPPGSDIQKGVGALLRPPAPAASREPSASPLLITALHTIGAAGPQAVFRMDRDPLVLRIDVRAESSLSAAENYVDANFQIVEYATNFVTHDSWWRGLLREYGTDFSIYQGRQPISTGSGGTPPSVWGIGRGLYLFRALIEVPALNLICQPGEVALFRVR